MKFSDNLSTSNFDIIGDIHGHTEQLIILLNKLGYRLNQQKYYEHSDRKVIFLGDFIDGGKNNKAVINIVRPMIEKGSAYSVLANHEFNAISYHTNHRVTNKPLRVHSIANTKQHQTFLDEYIDANELDDVINWFKTLPLFIETDDFRVIHACWSNHLIKQVTPFLNENNCLTDDFLEKANTKDCFEYNAVETLLKGVEIPLPQGIVFNDKSGIERKNVRIKWWLENATTYKEYALVKPEIVDNLPNIDIPQNLIIPYYYPTHEKPVFIGHYWLAGVPKLQASNVACLDYSVGSSHNQVAYSWAEDDTQLTTDNFVCSLEGNDEI
jgi:predicted MPP superfamily phosphohydrolase